jgi:hypothetical protein
MFNSLYKYGKNRGLGLEEWKKPVKVHFILDIDKNGKLINELVKPSKKDAIEVNAPYANLPSGVSEKTNFTFDQAERLFKKRDYFISLLDNFNEFLPVIKFLKDFDEKPLLDLCSDKKEYVFLKLEGKFLFEYEGVMSWWQDKMNKQFDDRINNTGKKGICLLSGKEDVILEIYPPIKSMGNAVLACSDKSSYQSWGSERSFNHPIGANSINIINQAISEIYDNSRKYKLGYSNIKLLIWNESKEIPTININFDEINYDDIANLINSLKTSKHDENIRNTTFKGLFILQNQKRIIFKEYFENNLDIIFDNIKIWFKTTGFDNIDDKRITMYEIIKQLTKDGDSYDALRENVWLDIYSNVLNGRKISKNIFNDCVKILEQENLKNKKDRNIRRIKVALGIISYNITKGYKMNIEAYKLGQILHLVNRAQYAAVGSVTSPFGDSLVCTAALDPKRVFDELQKRMLTYLATIKKDKPGLAIVYTQKFAELQEGLCFEKSLNMDERFSVGKGYWDATLETFKAKKDKKKEDND